MDEERAAAGFVAEIAYYLDHHLEGVRPRARSSDLRDRCAEAMRRALELPGLDHATARRGDARRARVPALPGRAAGARRAARARAAPSWSPATGTARCRNGSARAGVLELVDGVVTSAEVGAAEARSRAVSSARWRWRAWSPAEALHVGDSVENDVEGARAAGVRAVLLQRDGRSAGRGGGHLARFAELARPTLMADGVRDHRSHAAPARAPGAARGRRAALAGVVRGCRLPRGADPDAHRRGHRRRGHGGQHRRREPDLHGGRHPPPGRDLHRDRRPVRVVHRASRRAWHFGLRRRASGRRSAGRRSGSFSFYVLAAIYSAILQPDAEQTVAQDLGADQGTLGLIAAGFMIICVAPFAEEFFFRGFFYRALRTRYSVLVAALIDGLLFGADPLRLLGRRRAADPAAAGGRSGFIFCLVYERTGSLYPVIALHSFNNCDRVRGARSTDGRDLARARPADAARVHSRAATAARARPWHSERAYEHPSRSSRSRLSAGSGAAWRPPRHAQTPHADHSDHPVRPSRRPARPASLSGGGLATKKARYFAPAQEVVVRGVVKPHVTRRGAHAVRDPRAARRASRCGARSGRGGRFEFRFKVGNPGRLRLVVKHEATAAQKAFRTRNETIQVVTWQRGRRARAARRSLLLQRGLLKLRLRHAGHRLLRLGHRATRCNAFRKTNGHGARRLRDRRPSTRSCCAARAPSSCATRTRAPRQARGVRLVAPGAGAGAERQAVPRLPRVLGQAVHADRVRQLQLLPQDSRARTRTGWSTRRYFIGGYAIHGYADVPNYAGEPRLPARADPERGARSTTGSTSATRSTRTSSARRVPALRGQNAKTPLVQSGVSTVPPWLRRPTGPAATSRGPRYCTAAVAPASTWA